MENEKQENHNEKSRKELLREVVRRARKEEKQQYLTIVHRQCAIAERMLEIKKEIEILQERSKPNRYPEINQVHIIDKPYDEMSRGEFEEFIQNKRFIEENNNWRARLNLWNIEDNMIFQKKMKLIDESLELKEEFYTLEDKEKWLLLSIALRSQPNLLKYLEMGDRK